MTEPHDPEHREQRLPAARPVEKGDLLELDQSASSAAYDPVPAQQGAATGRADSGPRAASPRRSSRW